MARLIVTMPADMVAALDQLLSERPRHPARGCRSEFLRLAVAETLGRELMLSGEVLRGPPQATDRNPPQVLVKWDPKRYGERTVLAGDAQAPLALAAVSVTDEYRRIAAEIAAKT